MSAMGIEIRKPVAIATMAMTIVSQVPRAKSVQLSKMTEKSKFMALPSARCEAHFQYPAALAKNEVHGKEDDGCA